MTEEDMRKGYKFSGEPTVKFDPTSLGGREAMMNAAPKPSLETRIDRLEADARGARAAILRLDRDSRWHRVALWVLSGFVYLGILWRLFL